jgi:photosystem II stability/assembly factor-like uncharacterized protein
MQVLRLTLLLAASAFAAAQSPPQLWQTQESGTTAGLRGIDSVDSTVVWASGTGGTVLKTIDGGAHWTACAVPDAATDGATLDFRGVQAWDATTAIVMASGPGEKSRLYKTTDGCKTWALLLKNTDPEGFYDALKFWDRRHGLLLGDPVRSMPFARDNPAFMDSYKKLWVEKLKSARFLTLETRDGGFRWEHWPIRNADLIDPGKAGSSAFAASNSSIVIPPQVDPSTTREDPDTSTSGWIGIGGKGGARVLEGFNVLPDVGEPGAEAYGFAWAWTTPVPLAGGNENSGVFSLAYRNSHLPMTEVLYRGGGGAYLTNWQLTAVGGDYTKPDERTGTAAWSDDSGRHWTASATPPHGFRSAVQWSEALKAWITVGTNGSDLSRDDGKTWQPLDDGNWNALSLPFVVGPNGRIARINPAALPSGKTAP